MRFLFHATCCSSYDLISLHIVYEVKNCIMRIIVLRACVSLHGLICIIPARTQCDNLLAVIQAQDCLGGLKCSAALDNVCDAK